MIAEVVTLRPNQTQAADAVEDAWRAGTARPLVDSCVGSGKSLTMAELARRAWLRGERTIIGAHTRELVEQNAAACRALGLECGINAAALNERTWRAPVISAAIQSIYKNAQSFGNIGVFLGDEAHLWPHSEAGMYRALVRGLGPVRVAGFSGTVFRLQGGSLVEGEGAPFDRVVYRYSILDGIRDGYLVPAYSGTVDDKMDPSKLKVDKTGDYSGASQDAQMIDAIDNHIVQMMHHGANRKAWLIFEASTKAAKAMHERLNQWGIPTGLVLGTTPAAERAATIAAYRAGRLRALTNVAALTTGFDVPTVDMLVMRFKTKSLSKYIQVTGRLLRTIGGNIDASIIAGKPDGLLLDYGSNVLEHGPLDFIRPKDTTIKMVSCEECGKRNSAAAMRCWACDEPMQKLCPMCTGAVDKGVMDCPHCDYDMRTGASGDGEGRKPQALLETPSGAALIAAFRPGVEREGGWQPVRKAWEQDGQYVVLDANGTRWELPDGLVSIAPDIRWIRGDAGVVTGALVPNGAARNTVRQYSAAGDLLIVPMPTASEAA